MAASRRERKSRCGRVGVLVVLGSMAAQPVWGQTTFGTIEGAVRDASGGVMPGVTVEVASPALIEGSRTTVTEGSGNYRFLRLPVGQYALKFSVSGFKTLVRDGVAINADSTATINMELSLSTLEETVTVTGESPLVDVRTTTGQTVLTTEVVNTIPNSRNTFDMAKFVLGASTTTPDVGGSSSYSYTPIKIHGSRGADRAFYLDGLPANGYFGTGDTPINFGSTLAKEETNYQITAIPASIAYGGVAVSTVSKSGGNTFSGEAFANTQVAQSSNLDDDLRNRGVRATSGAKDGYDLDVAFGGPIKRDKVWFFGAGRVYSFSGLLANQFLLDGSQASDFVRRGDYFGKVSMNLTPTNRLFVFVASDTLLRPDRRGGATFVSLEAATYNYYKPNLYPSISWTGTRGDDWIFEAQAAYWYRSAPLDYRPEVGPDDVPRLDIVGSVLTGAPTDVRTNNQYGRNLQGSVTRVGNWLGSHELKTGLQTNWGGYDNEWIWHGDIILRFRGDVPDSVDLANTPAFNAARVRNVGVYVQDAWRIAQRLTINAGVRYDQFRAWMPGQSAPAGTWVEAREYPELNVKSWRSVVPRLGVAYDLSGNARTVVKGSFSKYMGNEGINIVDSQNPAGLATNRCAWTDTNGDSYAQANEISRCAGWSGGVSTSIDPDLQRPFNREYSLGIQHQLTANFAGSVTFFRREQRDLRATMNRGVPYETYIPVVITNPLNNEPLTIYNQDPATTGRQDNVLTNSSKLNTNYNGIEFAIQRRFSADAYLQGGYHYGKDLGRFTAGELNDPNADIFAEGAVGDDEPHQVKVSGAFMLPGRISVSTFFQAFSGHPRVRSLQVGRALVPTLTRATQTVRLERNDENRFGKVAMVDLRLGRRFTLGTWRFEAFADVFNLTNTNTVLADVTTIGSSLGQVSRTVSPRLVRLGGRLAF